MSLMLWLLLGVVLGSAASGQAAVKAFPTAEGYGAETRGAYGCGTTPQLVFVTSLANTGAGTLREVLLNTNAPRVVMFRIDGTINLESSITMNSTDSCVTIAGQTAPGQGIQIAGYPITVRDGFHDLIMRHVRIRPAKIKGAGFKTQPIPDGSSDAVDGFNGWQNTSTPVYNIILDHVSVAYALDESFDCLRCDRTTLQWSLAAEPCSNCVQGAVPTGHAASFKWGTTNLSVHHNLAAHVNLRNPTIGSRNSFEFINNVVYNYATWAGQATDLTTNKPTTVDFIGNFYKLGPNTTASSTIRALLVAKNPDGSIPLTGDLSLYMADNRQRLHDGSTDVSWYNPADPYSLVGYASGVPTTVTTKRPTPLSAGGSRALYPVTVHSALEASTLVPANVGATKPSRDSYDTRIITEVANGTGAIVVNTTTMTLPTFTPSTSYPPDADNDGMADSWETLHSVSDPHAVASNGWTNLENYLNELAGDVVFTDPPPSQSPVFFDLRLNNAATDSGPRAQDCTASLTYSTTSPIPEGTHYGVFNGSSSYLDCAIEGFNITNFTWAASLRSAGASGTQYAAFHTSQPPTNDRIKIWLNSSQVLFLGLGSQSTSLNTGFTFTNNVWYRVVVVRTGLDVKVYIDGSLIAQGTVEGLNTPGLTMTIGNSSPTGTEAWNGNIDKVRLQTAWTAQDVIADCNSYCVEPVAPFDPFQLADDAEIGLVADHIIRASFVGNPDPSLCNATVLVAKYNGVTIPHSTTESPNCVIAGTPPHLTLLLDTAADADDTVTLTNTDATPDQTLSVDNHVTPDYVALDLTACENDASTGRAVRCQIAAEPIDPDCLSRIAPAVQTLFVYYGLQEALFQGCQVVPGDTWPLRLALQSPPASGATVITVRNTVADPDDEVTATNNFSPPAATGGLGMSHWHCRSDSASSSLPALWQGATADQACAIAPGQSIELRTAIENTSGATISELDLSLFCALNPDGPEDFLRVDADYNLARVRYAAYRDGREPDDAVVDTAFLPLAGGITFAPVCRTKRREIGSKPQLSDDEQCEVSWRIEFPYTLTPFTDTLVCRPHDRAGVPLDSYVGVGGCGDVCGAVLVAAPPRFVKR